jgi:hypothetical protein
MSTQKNVFSSLSLFIFLLGVPAGGGVPNLVPAPSSRLSGFPLQVPAAAGSFPLQSLTLQHCSLTLFLFLILPGGHEGTPLRFRFPTLFLFLILVRPYKFHSKHPCKKKAALADGLFLTKTYQT